MFGQAFDAGQGFGQLRGEPQDALNRRGEFGGVRRGQHDGWAILMAGQT